MHLPQAFLFVKGVSGRVRFDSVLLIGNVSAVCRLNRILNDGYHI